MKGKVEEVEFWDSSTVTACFILVLFSLDDDDEDTKEDEDADDNNESDTSELIHKVVNKMVIEIMWDNFNNYFSCTCLFCGFV